MTGKRIGYVRVSTPEQNPDRQLEGISIDKKFIDYASARSTDRPQLQAMLDFVREDDVVIVHSMDRLARNLRDLKNLVDLLVSKKIEVHFIKENLQFFGQDSVEGHNSATSNLLLHLMGAFAEFEYAFIRERQREGIAIAKKKGKFKGKQKKLTQEQVAWLAEQTAQPHKTKSQLARDLNMGHSTLYRYLKEIKEKKL